MNIIAKINPEIKNSLIVEVDGLSWGVLDRKTARLLKIDEGSYTESQGAENLKKALKKYALQKILNYLAHRERALSEVENYCHKFHLHPSLKKEILDYLLEKKYIDNERFSRLLAQSVYSRGKSRIFAEYKLKDYSIDSSIIQKTLDEVFSLENISELIITQVRKAVRRYQSEPEKKKYEKCLNYLIRRGFQYYEVKDELDKEIKRFEPYE